MPDDKTIRDTLVAMLDAIYAEYRDDLPTLARLPIQDPLQLIPDPPKSTSRPKTTRKKRK